MRFFGKLFCATVLAASMASAASMVGWISDASCGASNGKKVMPRRANVRNGALRAEQPQCFVSEADQKVYKLNGNVDTKKHLDYKVQVNGDVQGDTIKVKEIKKAS
jgi:hypothetical protein